MSLSTHEGFNIPPAEAVLYGVPSLVLSDIPVHREIYGSLGAVFVPVGTYPKLPQPLPVISDSARLSFLNALHEDVVLKPLDNYLQQLGV